MLPPGGTRAGARPWQEEAGMLLRKQLIAGAGAAAGMIVGAVAWLYARPPFGFVRLPGGDAAHRLLDRLSATRVGLRGTVTKVSPREQGTLW